MRTQSMFLQWLVELVKESGKCFGQVCNNWCKLTKSQSESQFNREQKAELLSPFSDLRIECAEKEKAPAVLAEARFFNLGLHKLTQQDQFLGRRVRTGTQAIEIDSGTEHRSIPFHTVYTGLIHFIHQRCHFAPKQIKYFQRYE